MIKNAKFMGKLVNNRIFSSNKSCYEMRHTGSLYPGPEKKVIIQAYTAVDCPI